MFQVSPDHQIAASKLNAIKCLTILNMMCCRADLRVCQTFKFICIEFAGVNLDIFVTLFAFICASVVSLFALFCVYVSVFMHFRIHLFVYRTHCQLKFNFYLIFSDNENKKKTIFYLIVCRFTFVLVFH